MSLYELDSDGWTLAFPLQVPDADARASLDISSYLYLLFAIRAISK